MVCFDRAPPSGRVSVRQGGKEVSGGSRSAAGGVAQDFGSGEYGDNAQHALRLSVVVRSGGGEPDEAACDVLAVAPSFTQVRSCKAILRTWPRHRLMQAALVL